MSLLLRLFLLCCLALWLALTSSGCTTVAVPPMSAAKPTTCLLQLPPNLQPLSAEFNALAAERKQLEHDFPTFTPTQQDAAISRAQAIDNRQAQILVQLHIQDGSAYATAIAELGDCQDWIRRQP